jgi:hypothetical protein
MSLLDDMADVLAQDVMAAMIELDDDRLYEKIAKEIGAFSPSLQEAFLTSMRVRLAERRGRQFFDKLVARGRAEAAEKAAKAPKVAPE